MVASPAGTLELLVTEADPCALEVVEVCGYRDQSYDDAGTGGGVAARLESDPLGGVVVLLFFVIVFAWGIRSLRAYWRRQAFREGVLQ
jgi:hypothetical protein